MLKEFVESVLSHERNLFFLLNGSDSVFLDNIMWIVSRTRVWFTFYVFVALFLFYKTQKKKAALILLFFVLTIVLSDQISSGLIKPFFERLRPTHHPDFKDFVDIVHGHRGNGFSFVSGHASNSFSFAVFLSMIFRNRWVTLVVFVWATLISYSRIYLGVHFISDVVGGIVVGSLIALIMYALFVSLQKRLFPIESIEKTNLYSEQQGKILAAVFTLYWLGVLVYGQF
ncbi:MAG: phosphatase PAP2 family protein [Cyclobacteriaceae bacterium]|nr:phosphatase PAP2 family protein [Cyclobacteriaceae bacterium]MBX2955981.1 phosphatase PAP2 family protein [Cyclobacteriaceae bacterium]